MEGRRTRHARGTITLDKRESGDHVWSFRYKDEGGKYRKVSFATIKDYPTKSKARIEADRLRLAEKYITHTKALREGQKTFGQLVFKYKHESMPARFSTRHSYKSWLDVHIAPQWENHFIDDVDAVAVEQWLKDSTLAPKSKAHLKGLMTILFNHAMKWKWIPLERNPMELVQIKGGTRRRSRPRVLAVQQAKAFFAYLKVQYLKVLNILLMCYGPILSEVLGLQWGDIDWKSRIVHIRRAIVQGRVGEVKTEYRDADLPLHPDVAEILMDWRRTTEFAKDSDWIFASPFKSGEKPYFPTTIQHKIHVAAKAAGLAELFVGAPTKIMRHSYRSWLGATDTPIAVIKDLMRHGDVRTTFNTYGQTVQEPLRRAHGKVVRMVLSPGKSRDTSGTRKVSR